MCPRRGSAHISGSWPGKRGRTWKTFGHHPLTAFVDHGGGGSGEPVAGLPRPGTAGSNTAADHITTAQLAMVQPPKTYRRGLRTLTRRDSGHGTHEFTAWLTKRGRWLSYSVGMPRAGSAPVQGGFAGETGPNAQ